MSICLESSENSYMPLLTAVKAIFPQMFSIADEQVKLFLLQHVTQGIKKFQFGLNISLFRSVITNNVSTFTRGSEVSSVPPNVIYWHM